MEVSRFRVLLRTLLFSYLLSGLLILGLAFALYKLRLQEGQVQFSVYLIYLISCLAGGLICGKSIRQKRFLWGMLLGILYFAVLYVIARLLHQGMGAGPEQLLVNMALCAAAGCAGGMLS